MENKLKNIITLFIVFISLTNCEKFEARGFISSYELADERFEQSMAWNNNNPFKEITVTTNDYTLFCMGDSHVGGTTNMDIFTENAISNNAAAIIMTGDLTTGKTEDYNNFVQHIPNQDTINSFSVVGNHDLYFDGWKQFYSLLGSSTYLFTVKTSQATDLFICLDSGSGTLGKKQLKWLKTILENERSKYRHCAIITHNNLIRDRNTSSTDPLVEELYVLLDLCLVNNVNTVITGHDHQKSELILGNTKHIAMDALEDGYKYAGYLKLNISQNAINTEFINL